MSSLSNKSQLSQDIKIGRVLFSKVAIKESIEINEPVFNQ